MLRSVVQSLVGRVPQSVCNFQGPHISQFITNSYAGVSLRRFSLGSFNSGHQTDKPSPDQEQQTKVADKTEKPKRSKTPIGKLDELEEGRHPFQEKEPLPPWPDNTNPHTGEVGGPRGPEPTRYGDWERKGRVSDF